MKHSPAKPASPATPSKAFHDLVEKPVISVPTANPSQWDRRAFEFIDCEKRGYLLKHEIMRHVESNGVSTHLQLQHMLKVLEGKGPVDPISLEEFAGLLQTCGNFIKKVFESRLIIPEYSSFHKNFWDVYRDIKTDVDGKCGLGACADYIPSLGKADPNWFGTSFCSINGQYSAFGDATSKFSMQSVSKVVAYAMIYEIYAQRNGGNGDGVHEFVGEEPSGQKFNAAIFDKKNRPHNPMVNAGAIMVSTLLVNEGKTIDDFQKFYMSASCSPRADIDLPLYKEEALTGCNNHALRSLMLARGIYPQKARFEDTRQLADDGLDFYFVQCSMLVDAEGMARFGAMLANNGVNPSTNERIISPGTVKATISLMHSCGMYDGAGQFGKDHGAPTKSGVAGGLLTVIPGIGAIASFSPPLNDEGNCVRGICVIEKLSQKYSNINLFHKDFSKADMLKKPFETKIQSVVAACIAASSGDSEALLRLASENIDLNHGDYDARTPLHLACFGGHMESVIFLLEHGCDINPVDRWGSTPLNDAKTPEIAEILRHNGATAGVQQKVHEDTSLIVPDSVFPLLYAVFNNDLALTQSMLLCGHPSLINNCDYDGRTALGVAASEGHLQMVRYLVTHGADVDHTDVRGNNALADARREKRSDVAAYLESLK